MSQKTEEHEFFEGYVFRKMIFFYIARMYTGLWHSFLVHKKSEVKSEGLWNYFRIQLIYATESSISAWE